MSENNNYYIMPTRNSSDEASTGFGWVKGIIFSLLSVFFFKSAFLLSTFFFALALISIPPIVGKLPKFDKNLKRPVILLLFVVVAFLQYKAIQVENDRKANILIQEAQKEKERRIAEFSPIQKEVAKKLRGLVDAKKFQEAKEYAQPYFGLGNVEVDDLYTTANKQDELQRQSETKLKNALDELQMWKNFLAEDEKFYKSTNVGAIDIEKVRKTLHLFDYAADSINEVRMLGNRVSAKDKADLKQFEGRLSSFQQKIFPTLRRVFGKVAGRDLWQHDAYAAVSGGRNTVLNLSAGMFAANANIKSTQQEINELVRHLRYKQVNYRWFRQASEFTYYKIDSPPDGKIMMHKFGDFQELIK